MSRTRSRNDPPGSGTNVSGVAGAVPPRPSAWFTCNASAWSCGGAKRPIVSSERPRAPSSAARASFAHSSSASVSVTSPPPAMALASIASRDGGTPIRRSALAPVRVGVVSAMNSRIRRSRRDVAVALAPCACVDRLHRSRPEPIVVEADDHVRVGDASGALGVAGSPA